MVLSPANDANNAASLFAKSVMKETGAGMVATACPRCKSEEIGFDVMEKKYDCFNCNLTW